MRLSKCVNNLVTKSSLFTKSMPRFAMGIMLLSGTSQVDAQTFFGPTSYTSTADIPAGFYTGGSPTALEDFEDGTLDFGITASSGEIFTLPTPEIDSVDSDDGAIDGSGLNGNSFFATNPASVTFTFPSPVIAAGIVWTDGTPNAALMTTFEAFGPGMVSLGTIGPIAIGDSVITGTTAEDRFFGVQDLGGIIAIQLSNNTLGIEVDHIQFGNTVPEPSSLLLAFVGLALATRRRKSI